MKYTDKDKYEFLKSALYINNVDLWEGDALISMNPIYFLFALNQQNIGKDIETAIEAAMDERQYDKTGKF